MKVYNTLTRKKEEFVPINEGKVKMYVCGPTVYDYIHIGNARPIVVFDTVRKYLVHKGYEVEYVQNFTDIDDKIINRANEQGVKSSEVSEKFIDEVKKDMEGLSVTPATKNPKVTEEVPEIVDMIQTLIDNGHAYEVEGAVYFDSKSFDGYGKLSKRKVEDLLSGARVDIDDLKKSPVDFILWKPAKVNEPYWESPWSNGRPGWHIECSVMAKKYLGDKIDIHAGGEDLIFPHHENEIAQSECANGKEFAKYWLHNGFINIDNQKMSKSLGNFFTLREIVEKYSYNEVRFFLLSGHYRSPINFSSELMESSKKGLDRIENTINQLMFMIEQNNDDSISSDVNKMIETSRNTFYERMDDDFNTADAISTLYELVKYANIKMKENATQGELNLILDEIKLYNSVLGLNFQKEDELLISEDEILEFIEQRTVAKKDKNFAKADEIRDLLLSKNIVLEDTRAGVKWSVKK